MPTISSTTQERRKTSRREGAPPLAINLMRSQGAVPAGSVNFSERGLCLRVRETLEVRSLVRLQLTPAKSAAKTRLGSKPLECMGRVTWVVQRMDLRHGPPFLFDVGIEFVDPSAPLRRVLLQQGLGLGATSRAAKPRAGKKWLAAAPIQGREYLPMLERSIQPGQRWRLVVSVEGVPCFSEHYPSERAAAAGWNSLKRRLGRR